MPRARFLLLVVFSSVAGLAFSAAERRVPKFRQDIVRRMAREYKITDAELERLARTNVSLTTNFVTELDHANRQYEAGALSNNLVAIVALTNDLPKMHAELEAFKMTNPFGFGELFILVDAAWKRVCCLQTPTNLISAIRVRDEMKCCCLVMMTGLCILGEKSKVENEHLKKARTIVDDINKRIIPNARKYEFDKKCPKLWAKATETDKRGRVLVEGGDWEDGASVLIEATNHYAVVEAECMFL